MAGDALARLLHDIVRHDTAHGGQGVPAVVSLLIDRLAELCFTVRVIAPDSAAPVLVARRHTRGDCCHVVMYNHYDTEPASTAWTVPPLAMTTINGRWAGLGITDNKGALAARLVALDHDGPTPEITWLIQGEEECGSGVLRRFLDSEPLPPANLWLDENGWDDESGQQMALLLGDERLLGTLCDEVHIQRRVLDKRLVPGGCAFQAARPGTTAYLALGVNDHRCRIHAPDESLDPTRLKRHVRQLRALFAHLAKGLRA